MKCRLLKSAFLWGIVLCGVSQAKVVQWPAAIGGNDHFYEVIEVPGGISWPEANDRAMLSGGYLATITSAAENSFVYSLLDYDTHFVGEWDWGPWLGGFQTDKSMEPYGGWEWVTGETFVYTNWKPGNPDNQGGNEDYLHFLQGPMWNDIAPNGAWNTIPLGAYITEYIPEPATFVLFGLAAFLVRRRR